MRRHRAFPFVVLGLFVLATPALIRLWLPDPEIDWASGVVAIDVARPLAGMQRESEAGCSLSGATRLHPQGRLHPTSLVASGQQAVCLYEVTLGAHGAECLLEFPVSKIVGFSPTSRLARLAARYYDSRQGGTMALSAEGSPHAFLMLDARWCSVFRIGEDFVVQASS
jgi:hypothetical protein